jgi:hypothetical protein
MSAGSSGCGVTSASGIGCSHVTSGPAAASGAYGSSLGPPKPEGSGRLARLCKAVRQALVAI